jgi:hypothetical protein
LFVCFLFVCFFVCFFIQSFVLQRPTETKNAYVK